MKCELYGEAQDYKKPDLDDIYKYFINQNIKGNMKTNYNLKLVLNLFLLLIFIESTLSQPIIHHHQNVQENEIKGDHKSIFTKNLFDYNYNVTLTGHWANGSCKSIYVDGDIAYFDNGSYLEIVDISNPANPIQLGQILLSYGIYDICYNNDFLFIADRYFGLRIINVSNLLSPIEIGSLDVNNAQGIIIIGSYAYVVNGNLHIIDISDPANPENLVLFETTGFANHVEYDGNYLYLADGEEGLKIIDINNPLSPVKVGSYNTQGWLNEVMVNNNYAYLVNDQDGVRILDISNPDNPLEIGLFGLDSYVSGISINGNYVYLAGEGIEILDISNPSNPVMVGTFQTVDWASDVAIIGNHAVIPSFWKLSILDITNHKDPVEVGEYITGYITNELAVENNFVYLMDERLGLRIIDVSDCENPVELDVVKSIQGSGVKVNNSFAYITGVYSLPIIDMNDPGNPIDANNYDISGKVNDIIFKDNLAYVASEGLTVINVEDPHNPVKMTYYKTFSSIRFIDSIDDYVYAITDSLIIFDISNPEELFVTGVFTINDNINGMTSNNSFVFLIGDSIQVININDPSNPYEIGSYSLEEVTFNDISIVDDYIYVACKKWDDIQKMYLHGIIVIDISDPLKLTEMGYYYFKSGLPSNSVTINDDKIYLGINGGFFILQNDLLVEVIEENVKNFSQYQLNQNFPNPFNSSTIISYELPKECNIEVNVYDITGRLLETLIKQRQNTGQYYIQWNSSTYPSGLYFYQISAGDFRQVKKCLLLK